MILFDIETCPSWQNREQLYILFPQLMCPSDQEKIMEYPHFSVQLSLQYLCLSSHRMVLKNTSETNSICQDQPKFSSIYPKKGYLPSSSVFISRGALLGPSPTLVPASIQILYWVHLSSSSMTNSRARGFLISMTVASLSLRVLGTMNIL